MRELNEVDKIFEPVGLRKGNVFLLKPEDARAFVLESETRGLRIINRIRD